MIEIADNVVRVLVDEADAADDINEQEAEKAFEAAKTMLKESKDSISLQHAQTLMDRQKVRLQVAGLRRRKRR